MNFISRKSDPNRYSSLYRSTDGFGALEVLIVVATLALLAVVVLSGISRPTAKSARITCVNNLKQLGLAARMWSADNGDVFPWAAPISSNGVKELAFSGNVAALFLSMTNEILSSKILTCPADWKRNRETNWTKLSNNNISYFIGLDADDKKPQTIQSGDRNISGGVLLSNRVMEARATNVLAWGPDIHSHQGNIGLGDGSAQQLSDSGLRRQTLTQASNLPVARFSLP